MRGNLPDEAVIQNNELNEAEALPRAVPLESLSTFFFHIILWDKAIPNVKFHASAAVNIFFLSSFIIFVIFNKENNKTSQNSNAKYYCDHHRGVKQTNIVIRWLYFWHFYHISWSFQRIRNTKLSLEKSLWSQLLYVNIRCSYKTRCTKILLKKKKKQ